MNKRSVILCMFVLGICVSPSTQAAQFTDNNTKMTTILPMDDAQSVLDLLEALRSTGEVPKYLEYAGQLWSRDENPKNPKTIDDAISFIRQQQVRDKKDIETSLSKHKEVLREVLKREIAEHTAFGNNTRLETLASFNAQQSQASNSQNKQDSSKNFAGFKKGFFK